MPAILKKGLPFNVAESITSTFPVVSVFIASTVSIGTWRKRGQAIAGTKRNNTQVGIGAHYRRGHFIHRTVAPNGNYHLEFVYRVKGNLPLQGAKHCR